MSNLIQKTYVCAKAVSVDRDKRTITAVISTDSKDRDDEVIIPRGIDLKNYRRNPVVQWAHRYGFDAEPDDTIGKNLSITAQSGQLVAKTAFAPTEKADQVFELYAGGYLNMWSISFMPGNYHEPTEQDLKKRPDWAGVRRIYDTCEFLEYSAVPIGSNRDALALALSKGLKVPAEVQEQLEETHDPEGETDGDSDSETPAVAKVVVELTGITLGGDEEAKYGQPIKPITEKPYENEHACRLKSPEGYDTCRRKNGDRDHEGKKYDVIYCRKEGSDEWEEQAYRYPKAIWDSSAAQAHCKSHDGTFEAAKESEEEDGKGTRRHPVVLMPPKRQPPNPPTVLTSDDEIREMLDAKARGKVTWNS